MQANQAPQAQTTGQLLKYIVRQIPGRLLKSLPLTIAFGVGFWLLHTIILVGPNGGFDPASWLGRNILNTSGSLLSSSVLWASLGAILALTRSFIKKGGNPGRQIAGFFKLPVDILSAITKSEGRALPLLCFAAAAALLPSYVLSGVSGAVLGSIVMSSAIAFATGRGSLFISLVGQIATDVQTRVLRKKFNFTSDHALVIFGTLGAIMVLMGITSALPMTSSIANWLRYLWVPLFIVGLVLIYGNKDRNAPKSFMFLVGLLAAGYFSQMFGITALADDGGWNEAGGTFTLWINSQGAMEAVAKGLPPAIAGVLGNLVGSILSGIPLDFSLPPEPDMPATPDAPDDPGASEAPGALDDLGAPDYLGGPDDNPDTAFEGAMTCELS